MLRAVTLKLNLGLSPLFSKCFGFRESRGFFFVPFRNAYLTVLPVIVSGIIGVLHGFRFLGFDYFLQFPVRAYLALALPLW